MEDATSRRSGLFSRLKDGLKGSRAREEPVRTVRVALNAYGKLPIYKDFISAGMTDPGAREFRQWIDRGFSHRWSADEACRETEIPRHLFLLRLPESALFVTGCLWGSRDEGGLRRFPFTLFAALPEGHRAAEPLAATEHLELMNRQADAISNGFGAGGSLAGFYRAYRGAEIDLPVKRSDRIAREARADLERVSISSFAAALYPADAAVRWANLLSGLERLCGERAGGTALAARLPLSAELSRSRQLQFWLLWLSRRASRRNSVSGLLYPSGPGPGRLTLLFRDLRAEDIFLLHPGKTDYTFAEDFTGASAISSAVAPAQSGGVQVEEGRDGPLSSLLTA